MKHLTSFQEFIQMFQKLSGIIIKNNEYLIKITIEISSLILEHELLTTFKNSNNRYLYHSVKTNPPVRAHYHVYPSNGNNEIYAVNTDGTAHHKSNRGFVVPRKEAEELKTLGVAIKDNRIIEYVDFVENGQKQLLNESIKNFDETIYLKFEE